MAWRPAPPTSVGQVNDVTASNDIVNNSRPLTLVTNPALTWRPNMQSTDIAPSGGQTSYPISG